jgi:glycosyltransferase involved in cell wall biosynthesis
MSKKPSLSFYTNIPTPYQQSFFKELGKLFDLKVIYYAKTENNRNWSLPEAEGFEFVVLNNNFIGKFFQRWIVDFHFSWEIFKVAWTDKSDYIIVGGNYSVPNSTVALIFNKIKLKRIAYFSEPLYEVRNRFKYYFKWIYLRILNLCCDAIFCIGKRAADTFNDYAVYPPKYIIPYNIDPAFFKGLSDEKILAFKKAYKGADDLIILSSGALIERKGMDILIKAVKAINKQNLKLIIIGDGPKRGELMQIAEDDKRILFAGFQDPSVIPYFFAIADIFAFASRYDGWGVVINEAIASNVPIVCSDKVGAAIELITGDNLGLLCKSDDIPSFKEAIELLIDNHEIRNSIKKNSGKLTPLISSDYNARLVYNFFCHNSTNVTVGFQAPVNPIS